MTCQTACITSVSTHSRLKAAGFALFVQLVDKLCFNTQPPEGGWPISAAIAPNPISFNTQPPEGGWKSCSCRSAKHPRFNTQPPEGGWVLLLSNRR